MAVTRSTCEPHARPSRAIFVCGDYFSSPVRTTSWARTMRPSTVFRSFGLSPGMAMTASQSSSRRVAARRHPPSQPASFVQFLYVCSCTAARSTPGMLLLASQYDWPTLMDTHMGTPSSGMYMDDLYWPKNREETVVGQPLWVIR